MNEWLRSTLKSIPELAKLFDLEHKKPDGETQSGFLCELASDVGAKSLMPSASDAHRVKNESPSECSSPHASDQTPY
jgi:hypothetical protein